MTKKEQDELVQRFLRKAGGPRTPTQPIGPTDAGSGAADAPTETPDATVPNHTKSTVVSCPPQRFQHRKAIRLLFIILLPVLVPFGLFVLFVWLPLTVRGPVTLDAPPAQARARAQKNSPVTVSPRPVVQPIPETRHDTGWTAEDERAWKRACGGAGTVVLGSMNQPDLTPAQRRAFSDLYDKCGRLEKRRPQGTLPATTPTPTQPPALPTAAERPRAQQAAQPRLDAGAFLACREFAPLATDVNNGVLSQDEFRGGIKRVYDKARVYPNSAVTATSRALLNLLTTGTTGGNADQELRDRFLALVAACAVGG